MCERDDSKDVVEQPGIRDLELAMSYSQDIRILFALNPWLIPGLARQQSNEKGEGME